MTAKPTGTDEVRRSESCPLCGGVKGSHLLDAPDRFHLRRETYSLEQCSVCFAVWLQSPPKPEEMLVHYSEDYHQGIVAAGETSGSRRWKRHRTVILNYKQGGAILDLGCSSGAFLGTLGSGSWNLYGIEMEASTASKARTDTGAEVYVGDVLAAPFPPGSFDVITCFDVLEHVYGPREILARVLELLKPGGVFFITLPNIRSWEARIFGTYWYGLELPRHLFHFSPRSLRGLMRSVGLEEVRVGTPLVSYVERSVGYLCTAFIQRLGFGATPQSVRRPRSLLWRMARKAMRLGFVLPFALAASLAGAGPSIEGVFRKRTQSAGVDAELDQHRS
jgi:SAM-dependent methyltransferase